MNRRYRKSPEMDLLLLCILPETNVEAKERILEITQGPVNWDVLLELASWHTLTPLLHWNRATMNWPCPPTIADRLRETFTANSLRNLFLTGELAKLIRQFEECRIPVIAYKGPLLAAYYGNSGLRQFEDLDLLISKSDLAQVDRMLRAAGFQPSEQRLAFARTFDFELTYETEDQTVCVDLHWSLMPRFFDLPSEAGIWHRAITARLAGSRIRTLEAEDSLLLLCAHGTKHIWESLGWICDVARAVQAHPDLDWDALFQRAADLRMVRALSLGLLLAIELLQLQIPEPFRATITADPKVQHLADTVYRQLFEDRSAYWGATASSRFLMRSRDNAASAIRCGIERIFRPTKAEWRSIRLPRGLFPLYYLIRLLRLVSKHGGRIA
jgi:hypothetical protein